jgi:hypothetical protein
MTLTGPVPGPPSVPVALLPPPAAARAPSARRTTAGHARPVPTG